MRVFLFGLVITLFLGCERTTATSGEGYAAAMAAIGKGKPVMLEAGADYCTACKEMKAVIEAVRNDNPGVSIHIVNINKEREAAQKLGIRMIPTQIFYDGAGREVYRHVGGYGEAEFRAVLKTYGILKE